MKLPNLPDGYRWRAIETHKVVFEHIASNKSYGVRSFSEHGLDDDAAAEVACGVAKIERELERNALHARAGNE